MAESEEKPKEILDEMYFSTVDGVPMLTLHCRRKDCWLEAPGMVKHWPYRKRVDFTEVSAAVFAHQMEHMGRIFAKLFQGLK